jgi:hypothetical protein
MSVKFIGKVKGTVFDFRTKRMFGRFPSDSLNGTGLPAALGYEFSFNGTGQCQVALLHFEAMWLKGSRQLISLSFEEAPRDFTLSWKEGDLSFYQKYDVSVKTVLSLEPILFDGKEVCYEDVSIELRDVEEIACVDLGSLLREKGLLGRPSFQMASTLMKGAKVDREKQIVCVEGPGSSIIQLLFDQGNKFQVQVMGSVKKNGSSCFLRNKSKPEFSLTSHSSLQNAGGLEFDSSTQSETFSSSEDLTQMDLVVLRHLGSPKVIPFVNSIFGGPISPALCS